MVDSIYQPIRKIWSEALMNDNTRAPIRSLAAQNTEPSTHKIFIRDLLINMFIGVYAHEKTTRQEVRFNIDMVVEDPVEPLNDEYLQVVCYETIATAVQQLCENEHINLVETLAERVADICLSNRRVTSVVVKIEKLQAVKSARAVGVEIERKRS